MTEPDGQPCCARWWRRCPPGKRPTEHLQVREADLQVMLAAASTRGERTPSVDEVLDHVLAPLHLRALFGLPIEPGTATASVGRLLTT